MPQAFFIILAAVTGIFFIWRMKIDPLAVAFGSSIVYFTPGFFGVAQFSYGQGLDSYSEPIVPGAYAAMALVFIALTAGAMVADRIPIGPRITLGFDSRIPLVFMASAIVCGAIAAHDTGIYYLCSDKSIVLSKIGAWHYLASFSIPFGVATAYSLRRWRLAAIGALCLFAELYTGFRMATAIAFLACAMLTEDWIRQGWRKVVAFAAIISVGGALLFIVKHLIVPMKYATASYCDAQIALDAKAAAAKSTAQATQAEGNRAAQGAANRYATQQLSMAENLSATAGNLSHPKFYVSAFVEQSEAFVIQSTLNEVVRKDFHTDASYLIGQILTGLPLGASLFGIDSNKVITFNARVQPALFPGVGFGMANNPWAQAYAAGGQWMVAAFALGYAAIVGMLSLLFYKTTGSLRAVAAVIGVWIAFYFHRNDLFIEAVLVKHVVYIGGASILLAWLWDVAMPATKHA